MNAIEVNAADQRPGTGPPLPSLTVLPRAAESGLRAVSPSPAWGPLPPQSCFQARRTYHARPGLHGQQSLVSIPIVKTATNEETTPQRRRVDLGMDEHAARTAADARAQVRVSTPIRRLARVRITSTPTGEVAHVQCDNHPYRTADDAHRAAERAAGVEHRDGLPWYRAELPPAAHDCWRQSWHADDTAGLWLERCPCGGARAYRNGRPSTPWWFGRNSRGTGRVLSPSIIRRACAWLRQKGRP